MSVQSHRGHICNQASLLCTVLITLRVCHNSLIDDQPALLQSPRRVASQSLLSSYIPVHRGEEDTKMFRDSKLSP